MSFNNPTCPVCGGKKFTKHNKDFMLTEVISDGLGSGKVTGKAMRTKCLLCAGCGYVMLFKSSVLEGA